MTEKENNTQKLADWLKWSAGQMKRIADTTNDPILKVKYEKIAGINRQFCDKCGAVNQNKGDREVRREIDILKTAYFCQQAVYLRFCTCLVEENSPLVDEVLDVQKTIIRELFTEMEKRDAIL